MKFAGTKLQGNWGVGQAIAFFTTNGYVVSIPLNDSQDYDLLVDDGTICRVQVKSSTCLRSNGRYSVELRSKGGSSKDFRVLKRVNNKNCDMLFVAVPNGNYLIPSDMIGKSLALGGKNCKWQGYMVR